MAAITAARNGAKVTLLEKNRQTGKKLLVTGNGRCNFTNRNQELSNYRTDRPDVEKILQKLLNRISGSCLIMPPPSLLPVIWMTLSSIPI